MLSAKDKMIAQILEGHAMKVNKPDLVPEDENVSHARCLPQCWEQAIAGISLEEWYQNLIKQISTQLAAWCLEDEKHLALYLNKNLFEM